MVCIVYHKADNILNGPGTLKNFFIVEGDLSRNMILKQ
jgi:hypothetical protein